MNHRRFTAFFSVRHPVQSTRKYVTRPGSCPKYKYTPIYNSSLPLRKYVHTNPADDPEWTSFIDNPPVLVRVGQKHGPGLIILALMPVIAFGLGTWQIFRLGWKTELIAKFEDRIIKPPLPLPPRVDANAIKDFDYRRVYTTGHFRHDQEMLIGPRIRDGVNGYQIVTPLERDGDGSKILVNRGWITKELEKQEDRPAGVTKGLVTVEGLLRAPWTKNFFTPDNQPEIGLFVFPDVGQMAEFTGSEPIWIEETMKPDLVQSYDRTAKGIPIGRPAEVNLRNTHTQYIFTWYSLSAATTLMFWMVVRKQPSGIGRRIRANTQW